MRQNGLEQPDGCIRLGVLWSNRSTLANMIPLLESNGFKVGLAKEERGSRDDLRKISSVELSGLQVLLADLKKHNDPIVAAREIVERCGNGTMVIAVSGQSDIGTYRNMLAAGVRDYFAHPVPSHLLIQSLRNVTCGAAGGRIKSGRAIAIFGLRGGVGSSTLAAGLGSLLAQSHGRNTIIVDGDCDTPAVGHYLGIDRPGNLGVLFSAGSRLDPVLVEQAAQKTSPTLALLGDSMPFGETLAVDPESVQQLCKILDEEYRYQIWRSHGSGSLQKESLLAADIIMLVTNGSLACVRRMQGLLNWIAQNNKHAVTHLVYNHTSPQQPVPPESFAELIGKKFSYIIPYQRKLGTDILKSIQANSPAHCLHKILSAISADLMGLQIEDPPLFKRFMS